jgi:hypothetical protein
MTTRSQNPFIPPADLALLEEERRTMRVQALAYLEEADRLDALYTAVTGGAATVCATVANPNPDMGEF